MPLSSCERLDGASFTKMTRKRVLVTLILFLNLLLVEASALSDSLAGASLRHMATDSTVRLDEVVIAHAPKRRILLQPIPSVVADKEYLHRHLTGVWVNTLATLPGVQAMSIGGGFGKPMIRGLGFNRIAYIEGDIKQEGQQWGADHGLEVDAFEDSEVTVVKGPRSLLYGSDAIGGVILSSLPRIPLEEGFHGDATLLASSINGAVGGSLMGGYSWGNHYLRLRYSEQHFGDMHVNTDTITYLTIRIPIHKRRMQNSAGYNRAAKATYLLRSGGYIGTFQVSNLFEKMGFFPGAHGIPDLRRLQDDGRRYNIGLPFSKVNHLKVYTKQSYAQSELWQASLSASYQQNHRSEWSLFHTHYLTQQPPAIDPDKELELKLHTVSLRGEFTLYALDQLTLRFVPDYSYQWQTIAGYGFLIPPYRKQSGGAGIVAEYRLGNALQIEGGVRFDAGLLQADESVDPYLEEYLRFYNYPQDVVATNRIRSQAIDRRFSNLSGSLGASYRLGSEHIFNLSGGLGFRFPGVNELASNGVHHGSFRHDRGNPQLQPERALQFNAAYNLILPRLELSASAFHNYFFNYIYGTPTGEWSILPHSGQIFEYRQNRALLFGGELNVKWIFLPSWSYEAMTEYVYTYNIDRGSPLPFSPPLRGRQTICFRPKNFEVALTHHAIAEANRIVPGEEKTPSAQVFDLYLAYTSRYKQLAYTVALSGNNLLNAFYFDHLSYYRKLGLPEEGRNINLTIKLTF